MTPADLAQCRADMSAVTTAMNEILEALRAVPPLFGKETWQGSSADAWSDEWNARRAHLLSLLDAVAKEQQAIVTRIEKAVEAGGNTR
ncbi:hypothetical protein ACIBCT_28990 [Streptosporangium sp. NPDC050855]|uniref:hypothetical protein n=1 Tax=Streptosporangium sp. NPDC050855 TaxID=3366194 RepID=UPI0037A05911